MLLLFVGLFMWRHTTEAFSGIPPHDAAESHL